MKPNKIFIILLSIISINTLAQSNLKYVISVPLDDDNRLNQIEEMFVPVLEITDDILITVVDEETYALMMQMGIRLSKIDETDGSDKYYKITSLQDEKLHPYLTGKKIIFKDPSFLIVKNLIVSDFDALSYGFRVSELPGNYIFKNVRRILPTRYLSSSDSVISQITSSVNSDSVRYFIQSLQDFQTRFLFAATRDSVASWIKYQFNKFGYTDVVIDSFLYQGTWQKNVIATLNGIYEPDVFNVFGGHHDSYSSGDPMIFAPGADDNASGTAAVLETARVIMENNYQPESTIKFITFGAEEYGLWGSKDYAMKAYNAGMNIKIMINHDMISHTYYSPGASEVDINRYSGFEYLRDLAWYCIDTYSVLTPRNGSLNSSGSDSHSFWELGFPSVYFEETNFSPYYHSPADTIGNYSMEYCAEVIKSSCATLLMNIAMPTAVQNFKLYDAGTGSSLVLTWSSNLLPDFANYKIYVGEQSGSYDTTYTTIDTTFVLDDLDEGVLYYVGVAVVDLDGNSSTIIERSATPLLLPLPPSGFTVYPDWLKVDLEWYANQEYDLLGYNIYRSGVEGELGEKLNQQIYIDTTYSDGNAIKGVYYYYTVKAVDSLLNESENNVTVRSRVVSLDQGILIVDETADGDGTLLNPTDEQVDEFYYNLLSNFNVDEYDLIEEQQIGLADLGAYSTVVWHGNDFIDLSSPFESKESIMDYLEFGGNFIYTGYRPAKAFENVVGLNGTFSNGDFIFDYLKINESQAHIFSLFNEAINLSSGYKNIFVDSSKTLASDQYHLKDIEMISASIEGTEIYSYGTGFDSTSQQGYLKGKPIGVEYIGNDFRVVTLSFPLYYMEINSSKLLMQYILTSKFNEVMPVEKEELHIPTEFVLEQNYPNPFNPNTTIKYGIPERTLVELRIYDILGREIELLIDEEKDAGYYEHSFNASKLPSGIYLYRLQALPTGRQAGGFIQTKKMILIK